MAVSDAVIRLAAFDCSPHDFVRNKRSQWFRVPPTRHLVADDAVAPDCRPKKLRLWGRDAKSFQTGKIALAPVSIFF
ncbi:MAG: hypothetical protein AB7L90_07640 [Hyphomicrobiaceae bacterium]